MHYEVLALLKPVNFSLLNLLKNFGFIIDEICDFEQIWGKEWIWKKYKCLFWVQSKYFYVWCVLNCWDCLDSKFFKIGWIQDELFIGFKV